MDETLTEIGDVFELGQFKQYEIRRQRDRTAGLRRLEAWDTILQRPVLIDYFYCEDHQQRQFLLHRARKFSALSDPALPQIHAIEEVHDGLVLVFECQQSASRWRSLRACMREENLSHDRLRQWMLQAAQALSALHRAGLHDTDLRLGHFYIDQHERLRLLDLFLQTPSAFDTITALDQIDTDSDCAYLAPERFSHAPASAETDVYTLGLVFYELSTHRYPHQSVRGLALVAAITQGDSDQWAWNLPELADLHRLILHMTARNADQRIEAQALLASLNATASTQSIAQLAVPPVSPENLKPQRKIGSSRRLALILLGIVFVATAVLGFGRFYERTWPKFTLAFMPYSEVREMELGVRALKMNTLHESALALQEAEEHFSRVLKRSPDNASAVAYMALVYLARYSSGTRDEIFLQKAKASAQQAMSLNKNNAIALTANARVLQWHHKLDAALEMIQRAIALQPDNVFAWHIEASIFLEKNDGGAVKRVAKEGAERFPEDHKLLDMGGGVFLDEQNYSEAVEAFRLSLRRQPDSPMGYALLAEALQRQGKFDEALQTLQQGLQIRPSAILYSTLGKAKFALGDYNGAALAYANAASPGKGVTGSYERWLDLGEALIWVEGRQQEASGAYRKARELLEIRLTRSPDDSLLLAQMSLISARLGDTDRALQQARRSVAGAERDYYRLFLAAQSLQLLGHREEALGVLQQAIKVGLPESMLNANPILRPLRLNLNVSGAKQ